MRKLKIGVVGCGYWGPNLIRNFRSLAQCEMRLMCDRSQDRLNHLSTLYPEIICETDFSRMLSGDDLDAVAIATPVSLHYPMAKACLMAGKHTLVEKPLARSAAEAEELVELARQRGLTLMTGHTFLYSTPVKKIKELIQTEAFGQLRYISSCRANLGLIQKDINVAWDLAPHDLSIIVHLMGRTPTSVNCLGNSHVAQGVEDVTNMSLSFDDGRFAIIQNSWLSPKKVREMTIVGSKQMIVYDDVEPLEKIKVYEARVEAPPHYDSFAEWQYAYHNGDRFVPHLKQEEPLKVECQHFLNSIQEGTTPLSDGRKGLELVRILEAASQSLSQQGASVPVTPPFTVAPPVPLLPTPTRVPAQAELVQVA